MYSHHVMFVKLPPPRGFIKNLLMALSLIALWSTWPYKKFLYVLRLCWCYKPAPLKHLVVLHLRWTGVTLFCKLSQNEGAGERERQSAWMNPKPTCQVDSNSPTQRATDRLYQRPRCQLENRASPAQIHHGSGRCQGEWIHFNAGRYNMFFVL